MADNETVDNGSNPDYRVATDKVTYEGDADANIQLVKLVTVSGTEGSKTATAVTTGAQYVEDSPISADAGQGTLVVARRADSLATLTPAENDAVGLRVSSKGALWTVNDVTQLSWGQSDGVTSGNVTGDSVNAQLWMFNGSTSDRVRGDITNGVDVDVTRLPASTNTLEVVGDVASDVAIAANPLTTGARASTAVPTAVAADGRAVNLWANRNGAQVVLQAPHVGLNSDPWNLQHEGVRYTTAQTSAVVVAGGASEKLVVTKVQLQTEATTAGTAILYFGTGAFARGTNRACFDGNFIPSATSAPGVVMDGPFISGTNGDDLLFTSVGNLTIIVNVWYYIVT